MPSESWLLPLLVLVPTGGAILIAFIDRERVAVQRQAALMVSLVTLLLSFAVLFKFDGGSAAFQLEVNRPWVESIGLNFHMGIDGFSILLVLLTTFTMPLVLLSTWRAVEHRMKEFQICLLLLEAGMIGVFVSLDLVLFYLFWEAMLVPMYLLIGVWGGENRLYAAIKFFIYTLIGSLFMLLAIIYLWSKTPTEPTHTFDLITIVELLGKGGGITENARFWLFAAFASSFAVKVPLFPFHTWLPHAHVEAPTAGSVVLAAVLLKMGTYGFIRFAIPLFQPIVVGGHEVVQWLCYMSLIGIVYGACMALVQTDIKKLIAYSSISHLGYVVLGLFMHNEYAMKGAVLQMINHGLSTGMLFLLVGIIYERRHTRELSQYGGLAKSMPVYSAFFIIATLSSIGLPGLNGFVGEFLILYGVFQEHPWWGVIAATGVVLGAVYMLRLVREFLFGPLRNPANENLRDLSPRELIYLTPIVVMMVWIGLYPQPFLDLMDASVQNFLVSIYGS